MTPARRGRQDARDRRAPLHRPRRAAPRGTRADPRLGGRASAPSSRTPPPPSTATGSPPSGSASAGGWPATTRSSIPATPGRCSSRRIRSRWPGYLAAMLVNPNNHALDGGPATSELERRGGARPGGDVRPARRRPRPPDRRAARSPTSRRCGSRASCTPARPWSTAPNAHYTHARMCGVLGIPAARRAGRPRRADRPRRGRARVPRAATSARVVLTPGTTGLGAVDRVDEALALRERHGVRLHVDAAYGGFFTLLARRRRPARARGAVRARSPGATRSSSTPTSTACSPTAAGRSCSATRRSAASTGTTRRTPTSPPPSCTSARSASSARAPGAAAAGLWLTLAGAAARRATRASGRSSPRACARRARGPR